MNQDFSEMLSELFAADAEFLLVGAYALSAYGFSRATGDLDIWVRPTPENAVKVWQALKAFQAPVRNVTVEDFHTPDVVFQIGVEPGRIDILTSISGVEFDDAWNERKYRTLSGLNVPLLSKPHLLANKLASGRPKDIGDAGWLKKNLND
ncbi:hypothetical protein I41_06030 [Lacipirellula limnantheis]|uniref:Nucleotidyltransferase n=2 Tax=Lacipirellula limnantheis TaxID=2528024 RepID=A0A517TSU6_9BACT|nr:hypothetical protein I41_06030 [Lacipirellula limnantheis]